MYAFWFTKDRFKVYVNVVKRMSCSGNPLMLLRSIVFRSSRFNARYMFPARTRFILSCIDPTSAVRWAEILNVIFSSCVVSSIGDQQISTRKYCVFLQVNHVWIKQKNNYTRFYHILEIARRNSLIKNTRIHLSYQAPASLTEKTIALDVEIPGRFLENRLEGNHRLNDTRRPSTELSKCLNIAA